MCLRHQEDLLVLLEKFCQFRPVNSTEILGIHWPSVFILQSISAYQQGGLQIISNRKHSNRVGFAVAKLLTSCVNLTVWNFLHFKNQRLSGLKRQFRLFLPIFYPTPLELLFGILVMLYNFLFLFKNSIAMKAHPSYNDSSVRSKNNVGIHLLRVFGSYLCSTRN